MRGGCEGATAWDASVAVAGVEVTKLDEESECDIALVVVVREVLVVRPTRCGSKSPSDECSLSKTLSSC